ncbi:hypothetical protein BGZ63DRAFT_421874 [Mariannaea sp. PMI_226]|nr:hypothetical protein BGZ63DRAFT_421874 [Mariannaea sp. PMI_226]
MRSTAVAALAMGTLASATANYGHNNYTLPTHVPKPDYTKPYGPVVTETVVDTIVVVPIDLTIICYGDWCAPEHNWSCPDRWQIVCRDGHCCPEKCHGDDWDKIVICEGEHCWYSEGNCEQKIVCHGEECHWEKKHDEGEKKFVCHGEECCHEPCHGEECGHKEICVLEECKIEPICHENCPVPHVTPIIPVKPVEPCHGEHCPPIVPCTGDNCKPIEPCHGENCPCTGENCKTPVKPWIPEGCHGEHCPPVETPVIVSGASQKAVAGLAALIAGAIFAL